MSKEQQTTEAEGFVDRFLSSDFVTTTKVLAKTGRDLSIIFVPIAVATYLLHTQSDRIVLGIGVALALFGVFSTAKIAYLYERKNLKRR